MIDEDGYPTAKAVLPAIKRDNVSKIYFVTNTSSKYVSNVENNSKTSVCFYNPFFYKGCLLRGTMKIVNDLDVKKEFWKDGYKSAYPNSELKHKDPDFCVLEFIPFDGRYYSMFKKIDFKF